MRGERLTDDTNQNLAEMAVDEEIDQDDDDEEDEDEGDENIDDFIVDEYGRPISESQRKRVIVHTDSALQEAQEIFGVDFDFEEFEKYDEAYDEDEMKRTMNIQMRKMLVKKYLAKRRPVVSAANASKLPLPPRAPVAVSSMCSSQMLCRRHFSPKQTKIFVQPIIPSASVPCGTCQ